MTVRGFRGAQSVSSSAVPGPPAHLARRSGFRSDIEGLRAVAVAAVVLYHAKVGFLPGGYVGVDVFFVISGFLITGLLWREISERGRVSLGSFYARRARRLLPASMLVLVVTIAASALWLPPLEARSVWKDGLSSALYVGNYRFALQQTNYLTSSAPPSPFQHYWSLGVEEQFYLLWPLLLILAARFAWKRVGPRVTAIVVLGVVAVASFAASVVLTRADEPWAFFSLPTRAWELALGGLIALAQPWVRRALWGVAAPVAWLGLGLIVWSVVDFTSSTPFPGIDAIVPVVGAAAVIAGGIGRPRGGPDWLLGSSNVRLIGRISYSLYLWHWPVLILAPFALGHALNERGELGLVALSVALATATCLLVETPGRQWRWPALSNWRGAAMGGSLTVAGVAACVVVAGALPSTTGHGLAPVAALRSPPASARIVATHTPASSPPPPSAASGRTHTPAPTSPSTSTTTIPPAVAQVDALSAQVRAAVAQSASTSAVPANLTPSLGDATTDEPDAAVDGCLLQYLQTQSPTCLFGDPNGSSSIVLWGDSHATMWFPAIDSYANAVHARLYVWTKATCPPVELPMFSPVLGREFSECDEWRDSIISQIQELHPALVVFGIAPGYDSAYQITQDGPQWLAGLTSAIHQVRQSGARVAVIGPVPGPPEPIPDCLSANLDDVTACNISPGGPHAAPGPVGIDVAGMQAEQSTVTAAGGAFIDVEPWFCTESTCPVIVDNLLVFRDVSHITATYANFLAPLMVATLEAAGNPGG